MHLKLIASTPHPQFAVYTGDQVLVRIKIDQEMGALRIACNDNRRVFFIADEQFRKASVCTLLSEYSQPLGMLVPDRFKDNSGEIELEEMRFTYRIVSRPVKEIILFEAGKPDAILNCRINDAVLLEYSGFINYFIYSLAWFSFLAKEETERLQYQEA